jgi:hypothetical protein
MIGLRAAISEHGQGEMKTNGYDPSSEPICARRTAMSDIVCDRREPVDQASDTKPKRIEIVAVSPQHCDDGWPHYRVIFRRETLIEDTRMSLFDACRELKSRGLEGKVEVWGCGPYQGHMIVDID